METQSLLGTLSFAESSGEGKMILWSTFSGEGYVTGCTEGRRRATECLQMMRARHMPSLLGTVVAAIVETGQFGAVEIGFFQAVAEEAM